MVRLFQYSRAVLLFYTRKSKTGKTKEEQKMKKAVVTVLGLDQVGITAKVCTILAETNINILDISQTIVGGYFNMVMVVDITEAKESFDATAEKLQAVGEAMGLKIKMQHTAIFDAMHRI